MSKLMPIDAIIEDMRPQIAEIDDGIMVSVAGVAHAMDDVRKALDKANELLDERKFEAAAQLGYRDISSAYVFLQRTLGALQSEALRKEVLISEVATQTGQPHEDVEPFVTKHFQSSQPKYRVEWSEEDGEYVATCAEFPSLSFLASDRASAMKGIATLVSEVVADMLANGENLSASNSARASHRILDTSEKSADSSESPT